MFCGNCGKELEEGAVFCPYCGTKLGSDNEGEDNGQMQEPAQELKTVQKSTGKADVLKHKRFTKKIWIPVILVVCLIVGYFGYQKIVKDTIRSEIEDTLSYIQNGLDAETADQVLYTAVPQLVGNEMISNLILDNVSGEDVVDVCRAMMRYMNYEVTDVTKVESGHYQAVVRIVNLNNELVISHAVDLFGERYNTDILGAFTQLFSDLGADKSQLIAEMMTQSADDYYAAGNESYWISNEYTIDIVKDNGEWVPSLDIASFACGCLGLNL